MVEKCDLCQRERTRDDDIDYHPMQVINGSKIGWYNGEDGSVCGDCMTQQIRGQ